MERFVKRAVMHPKDVEGMVNSKDSGRIAQQSYLGQHGSLRLICPFKTLFASVRYIGWYK